MMAAVQFNRWARALLRAMAVAAVLAAAHVGDGARAQTTSGDAAAKAKFAITIARFVRWPPVILADEAAPLKMCVLHNSPALGAAFAALGGQRVAGHPVSVLQNPRDSSPCGLLFVDASVAQSGAAAMAAAAGQPMLTLGAVDGFVSQGGMIELANVNDTLRFDLNLKALRSAGMDVSSQVIQLARQVRN